MLETLLCLNARHVDELQLAEGFTPINVNTFDQLFRPDQLWLGPRPWLEQDEGYRQLVSYVVFRHGKDVLVYRRTPKGGESRLHGLLSVGVGGHVNLSDVVSIDGHVDIVPTLERACQRELAEEIECGKVLSLETIGVIKESVNAVSRVHLGVVAECRLEDKHLRLLDPGLVDATFMSPSELEAHSSGMETWSAVLVAHLVRSR
ncbi:MAG TPA: hypothetical protein VIV60_37190 [Polyangiaceae bacterium]